MCVCVFRQKDRDGRAFDCAGYTENYRKCIRTTCFCLEMHHFQNNIAHWSVSMLCSAHGEVETYRCREIEHCCASYCQSVHIFTAVAASKFATLWISMRHKYLHISAESLLADATRRTMLMIHTCILCLWHGF